MYTYIKLQCSHMYLILHGTLVPQSLVTAGLGSGLTEGLVITPFERVKVYMQAQRSRMAVVSEMIN